MSSDADHAARDTALAADHPRTDEAEQQRAAEPTPQRPLGRRVRALAARSRHPFAHGPAPDRPLEELIALHRAAHPRADTRVLQLAYEVADREHRGNAVGMLEYQRNVPGLDLEKYQRQKARHYLNRCREMGITADHTLVDQILDLAKMAAGRLAPRPRPG